MALRVILRIMLLAAVLVLTIAHAQTPPPVDTNPYLERSYQVGCGQCKYEDRIAYPRRNAYFLTYSCETVVKSISKSGADNPWKSFCDAGFGHGLSVSGEVNMPSSYDTIADDWETFFPYSSTILARFNRSSGSGLRLNAQCCHEFIFTAKMPCTEGYHPTMAPQVSPLGCTDDFKITEVTAITSFSAPKVVIPFGVQVTSQMAQTAAVAGAALSGGSGSGSGGGAAAAMVISRNQAILGLAACDFDPTGSMAWLSSPTRAAIGNQLPYYTGACLVNFLLCLVVLGGQYALVTYFIKKKTKEAFDRQEVERPKEDGAEEENPTIPEKIIELAKTTVKYPGRFYFGLQFIFQSNLTATLLVLAQAHKEGGSTLVATLYFCFLMCCAFWACFMILFRFRSKMVTVPAEEQPKNGTAKEKFLGFIKDETGSEWVDDSAGSSSALSRFVLYVATGKTEAAVESSSSPKPKTKEEVPTENAGGSADRGALPRNEDCPDAGSHGSSGLPTTLEIDQGREDGAASKEADDEEEEIKLKVGVEEDLSEKETSNELQPPAVSSFVSRYGALFTGYRENCQWFLAVDILFSIIAAFIEGLSDPFADSCRGALIPLVMLYICYCALLAYVKPIGGRWSAVQGYTLTALQFWSIVLVSFDPASEAVGAVASTFTLIGMYLSGIGSFVTVVLFVHAKVTTFQQQAKKKEKESSSDTAENGQHKNSVNDEKDAIPEEEQQALLDQPLLTSEGMSPAIADTEGGHGGQGNESSTLTKCEGESSNESSRPDEDHPPTYEPPSATNDKEQQQQEQNATNSTMDQAGSAPIIFTQNGDEAPSATVMGAQREHEGDEEMQSVVPSAAADEDSEKGDHNGAQEEGHSP